jgi:two-component system, cell cycle response regulator
MINKISIKFTVVSLFLLLSSIIISILLFVLYTFSQNLALKSIDDQFKILSLKVEDNINSIKKGNTHIIDTIRVFLKDKNIEDFQKKRNTYIKVFTQILRSNQNIYALYVGFHDNSFFEIINLNIDKNLKDRYKAKYNDQWLLIEITDNIKYLSLLNNSLEITSTQTMKNNYFVTSRPWYKQAIKQKGLIQTVPYNFSNIDAKGVTFAKLTPNTQNVFGLDLLINNLNSILKEFNGNILQNSYIVDKNGDIIAHSSDQFQHDQVLKIIQTAIKQPKETITKEVTINHKKYIYSILPLGDNFLCSYSDIKKILEPYNNKIYFIFLIIFIILLIISPLIFYFSSIIVKPILRLAEENNKIKNREFKKVQPIKTHVLEVHTLSNSLVDMSKSIHEYQTELEKKVKQRTLELQKINEALEKLSITDKLTNLYNRIKLDESIDILVERANRYNEIFGIILIDIDYFKKVNDTYGHQVGDQVLIEFATILQESVRKSDIVGRWGGEEFIIICPENSLENILILAEKIRKRVDTFSFSAEKHKTASFGIATYKKQEKSETMIDRADQALYIAKRNGRNQIKTLEKTT